VGARSNQMIEISQPGAKPGHGGVLPAQRSPPRIAAIRGVPAGRLHLAGRTRRSPPRSEMLASDSRNAPGMRRQADRVQALHRHPWEFLAICKAILRPGFAPTSFGGRHEAGTARHRSTFRPISAMPMRRPPISCTTRSSASGCESACVSVRRQDRHAFDIGAHGARRRTGATRRAPSCSRSACIQSLAATTTSWPPHRGQHQDLTRSRRCGPPTSSSACTITPLDPATPWRADAAAARSSGRFPSGSFLPPGLAREC